MDNTQHPNNYDNKAAHDTLKKMMIQITTITKPHMTL